MFVKAIIFFAYLAFAMWMLYGEIGLNRSGTKQGALNEIDVAERNEIKELLKSPLVEAQLKTFESRVAEVVLNSNTMNQKNQSAITERGGSVNLFDDKVASNDERIKRIQVERDAYIDKISSEVKKKYKDRRNAADSESNLISLGVAMPCAALFLCLFSAWVFPIKTPLYKNYGLLGSYFAQLVSSMIIFDAVSLLQGSKLKGAAISIGAFVCIPLGHYLAGLLWMQIQFEWRVWKLERRGAKIIQTGARESITFTSTQEHKVTFEQIPSDWNDAIELVAKERKLGNGTGLGAMVAKKFGKSEAWVSQSVKRRLQTGEVVVN